ncbi:uncharacterized protein LAJ45_08360 [Morchella importuna]|uniref:uncharacterized protein n=1 Tax=Morchella importuna TaxID=1174673 RepID=UPI001E8DDDC9|nr:uncharacterized protein LAJ45_08360 [Morchella importuna]KAH8147533.1 hypothetical protein LAJ45_08360 [Morchella importuna]
MERYLMVQGAVSSAENALGLKHQETSMYQFSELKFERVFRTVIYGTAIIAPLLFLLLQRVATGIPFLPHKDYCSYIVVNKKGFLSIYDQDELPSKAPIEELSGARLKIAWIQELCLLGLVAVSCKTLSSRISSDIPFFEEVSLASFLVPMLVCERDLWPKILVHPSQEVLQQARKGWEVYVRLGLSVTFGSLSMITPSVWYPVDPYSDHTATLEQTASIFKIIRFLGIGFFKKIRPTLHDALLPLERHFELEQFINPLCMRGLLAYIEKSSEPTFTPWVYVSALFFEPLINAAVGATQSLVSSRLVLHVEAAVSQSIMQKTLKIRITDFKETKEGDGNEEGDNQDAVQPAIGKITQLINSDVSRLINASSVLNLIASTPIGIIFTVILLYDLLGWASFVGEGLVIVTMILPGMMLRYYHKLLKQQRKAVDARIGLMTEALGSIRIIKFFGMERVFLKRIHEKRETELRMNRLTLLFGISYSLVQYMIPTMSMFITLGIYAKVMEKPLSPSVLFTSMSLFSMLRVYSSSITTTVQTVLESAVSFDRIDKFLTGGELQYSNHINPTTELIKNAPFYKDATLSWASPGSSTDNNFRLSNMNVECVYGGLTVISGPVGSGKSSFLLGLLGEMRLLNGNAYIPRNEGVAYVAQSTWLQNKTIRDNILFGEQYEEKRYNAVLEACDLSVDLSKYEDGDLTEVGEKGVTLSGGQKARLSLARAVYSPAQTLLLDDVLSALDAATSRIVFDKCINGEVLAGRTVVLVTHHVSLVSSYAKKIVVLADGKIISDGLPQNIPPSAINVIPNIEPDDFGNSGQESDPTTQTFQDKIVKTAPEVNGKNLPKLVKDEDRAKGKVPIVLIWDYIKSLGSPIVLVYLVATSVLMEFAFVGSSLFLAVWSDQYSKPGDVNVNLWLGMYSMTTFGVIISFFITYVSWYYFIQISGKKIHEKLVKSVLYSPIRFFDTTPVGRILGRLSSDIYSIDWILGRNVQSLINCVLNIAFTFTIMFGLIPVFLVPCLTAILIGTACREFYLRTKISVNRIYSIQAAPVISHLHDTVSGVVTIRAYNCQRRFLDENLKKLDDFNQVKWTLNALGLWMTIRSTACTAMISAAAGFLAINTTGYTAGLIGFSMNNCLSFSSSVLSAVSDFNRLQVELNSYDRVVKYIKSEQEKQPIPEHEPSAAWPTQGDVKITNLSVKYSTDGPEVLNKVSFDVKSRERVGIVGRTGAGKSSLALSLLRFTEISNGSITIDGLDITKVNLESLRQRITIIPQDPIMFSGTVRDNLDPYHEIDDTELQAALESSGLVGITNNASNTSVSDASTTTSEATELRTKQIGLDSPVTSGGDNLSQGQRQLLAFARALVRRSKLVILDEATSSTDMETDERIQQTLRTSFPDSSIITIAHRLRTVMSFDRIIVLDNLGKGGEVVECDTPFNLLRRPGGVLCDLARKSGEFEELLELATKGKALYTNGE